MATQPIPKITEEEYLEHERNADWPSEYLNGEVFPMDGASFTHGVIQANIAGTLIVEAGKRGCIAMGMARLLIEATGLFTYPDVMVICGEPRFSDKLKETSTNPVIIFEILSRTTVGYDRGEKFDHYRTIPSLGEYITINQYKPHVIHNLRQPDNSWVLTDIDNLQANLTLASLECELPLSNIYKAVTF